MAADSEEFAAVVRVVARGSTLNELQARGLVRRLLNQAGLSASDVTADQLGAVGRTLLKDALVKNGITDPTTLIADWGDCCARQAERSKIERGRVTNTVEEVFARMGIRR